jgi:CRISPR/Cas system Type II protein with McrA/HNH and RuvC-like nuclease domain
LKTQDQPQDKISEKEIQTETFFDRESYKKDPRAFLSMRDYAAVTSSLAQTGKLSNMLVRALKDGEELRFPTENEFRETIETCSEFTQNYRLIWGDNQ